MHFPGSRVKLCDFLGKILQKNINSLQIELDTSHLKRLQNRCGIWIVASIGKYISLGNARLLPAKIQPIAFSCSEKNLGSTIWTSIFYNLDKYILQLQKYILHE